MVDIAAGEGVLKAFLAIVPPLPVSLAHTAAGCVDPLQVSCLSILDAHQTHVRQFCNTSVVDLYGDNVVLAVGDSQRLAEVALVDEVAEQEARATAFDDLCQVLHCLLDIGALALSLEVEKLADDVEDVLATLLWWDKLLDVIGEEDDTNLVVVLYGAESQCCLRQEAYCKGNARQGGERHQRRRRP